MPWRNGDSGWYLTFPPHLSLPYYSAILFPKFWSNKKANGKFQGYNQLSSKDQSHLTELTYWCMVCCYALEVQRYKASLSTFKPPPYSHLRGCSDSWLFWINMWILNNVFKSTLWFVMSEPKTGIDTSVGNIF
jgi:hypothetical protein